MTEDEPEENSDDERFEAILKAGGIFLGIAFCGWLFLGLLMACSEGMREGWGQIGDSFGSLNALFSAGAVYMALYAIHLQRKDHKLQREAHTASVNEYRATKEAQEIIAKIQVTTTILEAERHEFDVNLERLHRINDLRMRPYFKIMRDNFKHHDRLFSEYNEVYNSKEYVELMSYKFKKEFGYDISAHGGSMCKEISNLTLEKLHAKEMELDIEQDSIKGKMDALRDEISTLKSELKKQTKM